MLPVVVPGRQLKSPMFCQVNFSGKASSWTVPTWGETQTSGNQVQCFLSQRWEKKKKNLFQGSRFQSPAQERSSLCSQSILRYSSFELVLSTGIILWLLRHIQLIENYTFESTNSKLEYLRILFWFKKKIQSLENLGITKNIMKIIMDNSRI